MTQKGAVDRWSTMLHATLGKCVPVKVEVAHSGNKLWYSPFLCRLHHTKGRLFQCCKHLARSHHLSTAYRQVPTGTFLKFGQQNLVQTLKYAAIGGQFETNPRCGRDQLSKLCVFWKKMMKGFHQWISTESFISADSLIKVSEQCGAPQSAKCPVENPYKGILFHSELVSVY